MSSSKRSGLVAVVLLYLLIQSSAARFSPRQHHSFCVSTYKQPFQSAHLIHILQNLRGGQASDSDDEYDQYDSQDDEDDDESKIEPKNDGNKQMELKIATYDDQVSPPLYLQMLATVGVMLLSRRIDLLEPKIVRFARYVIFLQTRNIPVFRFAALGFL
jgi:hypothetical protein